jgi:hypothetical protein
MHDKYWFLAALLLVMGAEPASAQNANSFPNLFGRTAPPAQAEWRKVPRDEIGCIDRALAPQRTNVQTLIQQGVTPNDPRIGQVRALPQPNRAAGCPARCGASIAVCGRSIAARRPAAAG